MATLSPTEIEIVVITDVSDVTAAYDIVWACFGEQAPDAIIAAFNPFWDTPDGFPHAVQRMVKSFNSATNRDKNGDPTQIFLKATTVDAAGSQRIVGFAIWIQLSAVEGYGEPPLLDSRKAMEPEDLYPDNVSEQDHCCMLFENLYRQRHQLIDQQSTASPPAIMALDMCVVHPSFQRRGIAARLVKYGLDEAERRGGLVSCTEASTMGRSVYAKLGFRQEGPEIEYGVDGAKFARNGMPSNVFMRTK